MTRTATERTANRLLLLLRVYAFRFIFRVASSRTPGLSFNIGIPPKPSSFYPAYFSRARVHEAGRYRPPRSVARSRSTDSPAHPLSGKITDRSPLTSPSPQLHRSLGRNASLKPL